jgi:hypothetical protein
MLGVLESWLAPRFVSDADDVASVVEPICGVKFGGVEDPNGENVELNDIVFVFVFSLGRADPGPKPVAGGGEKNLGGDA